MKTITWNYIIGPSQAVGNPGTKMQVNLRAAFQKTLQRLDEEPFIELKVVEPENNDLLSLHIRFEQYVEEVDQLFYLKSKRLSKSDTLLWLNEVKQCHNELKRLPIANYFFHDLTDIAYWKTAKGTYRLMYSQANPHSQVIIAISRTSL